jgi:ABC-2 type transport system ATP-binding protein
VLGLLGVNGAGKSTTLSMIAGALRPDSGGIQLNGEDFLEHPELARQADRLAARTCPAVAELTVREHLDAHGRLRGLKGAGCEARTRSSNDWSCSRWPGAWLACCRKASASDLGLACALLHRPALLVLDEPANALDPVQVAALRNLIREQAASGTAVILSTHLLTEVTAVCDRVAILHEGTLRHDGRACDDHAALERTFFDIAMNGKPAARRMSRTFRCDAAGMAPPACAPAGLGTRRADAGMAGVELHPAAGQFSRSTDSTRGAAGWPRLHDFVAVPLLAVSAQLAVLVVPLLTMSVLAGERATARCRCCSPRCCRPRASCWEIPGGAGLAAAVAAADARHAAGTGARAHRLTGASWPPPRWALLDAGRAGALGVACSTFASHPAIAAAAHWSSRWRCGV